MKYQKKYLPLVLISSLFVVNQSLAEGTKAVEYSSTVTSLIKNETLKLDHYERVEDGKVFEGESNYKILSGNRIQFDNILLKSETGSIKMSGIVNRSKLDAYKDPFDVLLDSERMFLVVDGKNKYNNSVYNEFIDLYKEGKVLHVNNIRMSSEFGSFFEFSGYINLDNPFYVVKGTLSYNFEKDSAIFNVIKKTLNLKSDKESKVELVDTYIGDLIRDL